MPSRAARSAIAKPIPRLAPETTIVLSFRSISPLRATGTVAPFLFHFDLSCRLLFYAELFGQSLSHLEFLDLSSDRHGELRDETYVVRNLVMRDFAFAEFPDLLGGRLFAFAQLNPRRNILT